MLWWSIYFYIYFYCNCNIVIGTDLPSSCIGLHDGYHWIKMLRDDVENDKIYPPIHVLCSNEYMILDVHHDENIMAYFNSFDSYHYALSGSNHQNGQNWQQWFIPSSIHSHDDYGNFLLSPDCHSCDMDNEELQEFDTNTAYYMTGTMFGCLSTYKAERDCAWDWNTYQCTHCTMDTSDADLGYHTFLKSDHEYKDWLHKYDDAVSKHDPNSWWFEQIGLCGVYPRPADTKEIAQTRQQCFAFNNQYNPSIGTDGRFCQCYKPPKQTQHVVVHEDDFGEYTHAFKQKQSNMNDDEEEEQDDNTNVVYLYQSDFVEGTYRIRKAGTYILMEDIEFDFNSGNLNDPNSNSDDSWWPNIKQQDEYPGAYGTRNEYFMGFFAGITIETNDVVLDLNGHEIGMSVPFYFQQRFFNCIALQSVVFNLNQGPGIFGTNPQFATNVMIKDGTVGLSSHHGIHGHGNSHVVIENVHVHNFETHGIQFSAFNDIKLKNVEIGPSSSMAYLNGEYGFARFTLQRLERIKNDPSKQQQQEQDPFPFRFSGRDEMVHDIDDIIDPLRKEMDMAFKYVMHYHENGVFDESLITAKAKELFINEDGIPYGAVMYGLFLNLYFANVFQIHPSLKHSHGAIIENVEIHDLVHKTREYLRLDQFSVNAYANPYNAALDAEKVLGHDILSKYDYFTIPWDSVKYVGDVLIDAHIALNLYTTDWSEKGLMDINEDFSDWALGKHEWSLHDEHSHPFLGCNGDRMTHSAKGIMGIRIDGVEEIEFNSLNIHNLHEQSPIGSTLCSAYWDGNMQNFFGTGHFLQNTPYLYGYTGNMVHAIFADFTSFHISGHSKISDLYSDTGLVHAIGAYVNTKIDVPKDTNLEIYKLGSGIKLLDVDTSSYVHPYQAAVTKPFHIISEWTKYENTFYSEVNIDKDATLNLQCLFGRDGVDNDLNVESPQTNVIAIECNDNFLNVDYQFIIHSHSDDDNVIVSILLMICIFLFILCRQCQNRRNNDKYSIIP